MCWKLVHQVCTTSGIVTSQNVRTPIRLQWLALRRCVENDSARCWATESAQLQGASYVLPCSRLFIILDCTHTHKYWAGSGSWYSAAICCPCATASIHCRSICDPSVLSIPVGCTSCVTRRPVWHLTRHGAPDQCQRALQCSMQAWCLLGAAVVHGLSAC